VGTKEKMEEELNKLREHYVHMLTELWASEKLYDQLEVSYKEASVKYWKKFRKKDKDGKYIIDKDNPNSYVIDDRELKKYLRENPNKFYDRNGAFQEEAWREWLDSVWRKKMQELIDEHKRIKANYAAIAWPREYNEMTNVLKMMLQRSAERSIQVYKWNGLEVNKKDREGIVHDWDGEWPTNHSKKEIQRKITDIRYRLKLDKFIQEKKSEKEEEDD
jgi:hypothetical protein